MESVSESEPSKNRLKKVSGGLLNILGIAKEKSKFIPYGSKNLRLERAQKLQEICSEQFETKKELIAVDRYQNTESLFFQAKKYILELTRETGKPETTEIKKRVELEYLGRICFSPVLSYKINPTDGEVRYTRNVVRYNTAYFDPYDMLPSEPDFDDNQESGRFSKTKRKLGRLLQHGHFIDIDYESGVPSTSHDNVVIDTYDMKLLLNEVEEVVGNV